MTGRALARSLLACVLVAASCALVHELLAATLASYVLGNSVRQYSLVIGVYLSAMGVGAWASRRASPDGLGRAFVGVELALALTGGLSAPTLTLLLGSPSAFRAALFALSAATGALVGAELPILMRLLDREMTFRELVSRALLADHIGSLVASWLFPWLLVPVLGLLHASLAAGGCNALVGLWCTWLLRDHLGARVAAWRLAAVSVVVALAATATLGAAIMAWVDRRGFV